MPTDVPRLSSLRLRYGKRHAPLSPNQPIFSFVQPLLLPPLLLFSKGVGISFFVSQSKALRSKASISMRSCILSFYLPIEFLAAASNLSSFSATGPDKATYPMLKHLSRSGMDFLHISIFSAVMTRFYPSGRHLLLFPFIRWESLSTLLLPSGLSLSPPESQIFFYSSF